ncbi:DNA-binding protein [Sphaerosporella brunnea]|uniref:DNA-binding protein n=1 Tax=Sphaerosporella brunnea TaxID=1250544 RepID=A0A5J5ESA2_9PEZI|nr:DNA-binding protein [Sphaerosporella brunnea]
MNHSNWEQAVTEILSQNAEPVGSPNDGVDAPLNDPAGGSGGQQLGDRLITVAGIVETFVEHVEVAIHTILYHREIYPRELFMATRMYNTAVKMCRVPRVARYVRDVVEQVGQQLQEGNVKVVSIVILSENRHPLERFSFNVSSFPQVEKDRAHALLLHNNVGEGELVGTSLAELYEQFRALIMQISACSGKLGNLPENCTWTTSLELIEGSDAPKDHTRNWVVSERQKASWGSNAMTGLASGGVKSMPLRSIEAGAIGMDIWVEESNVKKKLPV